MEMSRLSAKDLSSTLKLLQIDSPRNSVPSSSSILPLDLPFRKKTPRRLVSLCIGVLGQHLEDIIADISEIAAEFPPDIKLVLLAIARRRQLLNDDVLLALAESLWDILDVSGSDVTDVGLSKVSLICSKLRAVDISGCEKITVAGVTDLFHHCRSLTTLRCGGSPRSEFTARRCLNILKPKLDDVNGESWEELDSVDIGNDAQSLCWLVWPKIDEDSKQSLATECPRICINPRGSTGLRGVQIPVEAMHSVALDHDIVEDVDPKTWTVSGISHAQQLPVASVEDDAPEMSVAEKFRLAFVERDARLAPKRAKNARQHRRRAEKEMLMSSDSAKSLALASQAGKFLYNRN